MSTEPDRNHHQPLFKPGQHSVFVPLADQQAFRRSAETDAVADSEWFYFNPGVNSRVRPMSRHERKAFDLPVGTKIKVTRLQDGLQSREFVRPNQG